MPVYEYFCPSCKSRFDQLRPMSAMDDVARCIECDTPSRRVISLFAVVNITGSQGRSEMYSDMPYGDIPMAGGGGCACGGNCACSM